MAKAPEPEDLMRILAKAVKVGLIHLPDSTLWDKDWAWDEYSSDEQEVVKGARRVMSHALELYKIYQELDKAIDKKYGI